MAELVRAGRVSPAAVGGYAHSVASSLAGALAGAVARAGTELPRPDRIRESPSAAWFAVAAVCAGAFMGQLDASIVTVATPDLRADLGISLHAAQWASLSYLLVLVGAVAPIGRASDMIGRKLVYVYGFGVFGLASAGCALSTSLPMLIGLRAVQAIGAAMLQANSVALIRTSVPRGKLTQALGIQGAAQAIGLALGPLLGGFLVGWGGWQSVFWVNVPVSVVGIALGLVLLPRTRERAPRTAFDWLGCALLIVGCTTALLALSWISTAAGLAVLLGIATVLGAVAFVRRERRFPHPVIDLAVMADRRVRIGVATALLAYATLFGALFVSPLQLAASTTLTPARIGLMCASLPIGMGVMAPFGAACVRRLGARLAGAGGLSIAAAGCLVAGLHPVAALPAGLALIGVGLGVFIPANNAAVAGAGRADQAGMLSGVINLVRGMGTAIGIALASLLFVAGGADGLLVTMVALAVLAIIAVGLTLRAPGRSPR